MKTAGVKVNIYRIESTLMELTMSVYKGSQGSIQGHKAWTYVLESLPSGCNRSLAV